MYFCNSYIYCFIYLYFILFGTSSSFDVNGQSSRLFSKDFQRVCALLSWLKSIPSKSGGSSCSSTLLLLLSLARFPKVFAHSCLLVPWHHQPWVSSQVTAVDQWPVILSQSCPDVLCFWGCCYRRWKVISVQSGTEGLCSFFHFHFQHSTKKTDFLYLS